MTRIGDPSAVPLLRERWSRLSAGGRTDAADILGRIQVPESEEALLALFLKERDRDIRFFLAKSLCALFSREGVDLVRKVIRDGSSYDDVVDDPIEEKLLPVIDLLGIDLPEAESWRKEREEGDRR